MQDKTWTGVFVSYRHSDSSDWTDRLVQRLRRDLSPDSVFHDVTNLQLGKSFSDDIASRICSCAAMLVVIGPTWIRDFAGASSIGGIGGSVESDWVRKEIYLALSRDGLLVVPILVAGAELPQAKDLPPDIRPLVYRHAFTVNADYPDLKIDALVADLKQALGSVQEAKVGIVLQPQTGHWVDFRTLKNPYTDSQWEAGRVAITLSIEIGSSQVLRANARILVTKVIVRLGVELLIFTATYLVKLNPDQAGWLGVVEDYHEIVVEPSDTRRMEIMCTGPENLIWRDYVAMFRQAELDEMPVCVLFTLDGNAMSRTFPVNISKAQKVLQNLITSNPSQLPKRWAVPM